MLFLCTRPPQEEENMVEALKYIIVSSVAVICIVLNVRILLQMNRTEYDFERKAMASNAIRNCIVAILIIVLIAKLP